MREASGPGKPAMIVDLDHDGHRIVGLDLSGADTFVGAVLTLGGEIVVRREVPVPTDDVVGTVIGPVDRMVDSVTGSSAPKVMDPQARRELPLLAGHLCV